MKALMILVLMVAPAAAETLEADLGAMRKPNSWPVRGTLLGWTADHRVVYRSLICDTDAGGGRGPACDLALCVAAAGADYDPCTSLESLDLNRGEEVRQQLDSALVVQKAGNQLAMIGALEAGRTLATSTFRTTVDKGVFEIERTGPANRKGRVVVAKYLTREAAEAAAERPEYVSDPKMTAVSMSKDGKCVAVLGQYRFDGHYEALETTTPSVFVKVICAASAR
jgi:hypothetical protein